ncbi:MAG: type VI secretion system-associated protein TagO [Burkholderiaceae bacterium]
MIKVSKALFYAGLAVFSSSQAFADVDKGLAECAAMDNSVTRLACFDALSSERGAVASIENTTSNKSGKWETATHTDPMTDKSIYIARLDADTGERRLRGAPSIMVRCKDNKTEMYINWNDFLGSRSISTTYRIDKEPAQRSEWDLSTDKKSAFFPGSPVPMLKKLVESSTFAANVTPYNESPVTAIFNTTGADKALADIRKGCNW